MARTANPADAYLASLTAPVHSELQKASACAVLANLLWIVQAAAVASVIASLVDGADSASSPWLAACVFLFTGVVRSLLDYPGRTACAFERADTVIGNARNTLAGGRSHALAHGQQATFIRLSCLAGCRKDLSPAPVSDALHDSPRAGDDRAAGDADCHACRYPGLSR